ncbi:hypothetical protein HF086_013090 [Spodoptera exigua]|uniref:TEP1-F n=1 Tax=Spodoptera exigua TaxID=7107 RepID=A0A922SDC7_SPOEX|nr:hypothetical protein HF086_013090 [Spodoptera exigua]
MTHNIILYYFLVALTAPLLVQCISVLGPKVLRPFNSYTVAIAGGSRAYTLYVAVEGRRANGEQFTKGREVQVPAAATRLIELEIGDPGPGQYSLVARSTSGPLFSSSSPLFYQPRSFAIFVQTDKRVYQPKDTINFRVIALDKYLLPLSTTVDVSVLDTGGSPIRQWAGVELDRGVLTQELVLADEPALGEWTIQVEARGQKYSRRVLVADYVQPRFHMEMNMPKEVLFTDGRFDINVTAKHFNGLPVRGELTISAYPVFFSGVLQPVVAAPTRKVVDINGQAQITFDLNTDLDLAEDAARPLVVEAVIEEKDTLIKQNITNRILLLRTPYRLKVKYKEVTERVVNVQRSEYSFGQFLTAEILTRGTGVGGEMRARITATEPMDMVHYAVEREVESFNGLSHSIFKNEDHLPGMGLDLSGYTAADVFKNAGVVILTDGVVVKGNTEAPTQAVVETGTRAPQAGPYAFSRLPPPPSPRNDGQGAKERWTAVTPGEFSIGAFSVHPTLGLGLASPQKFTTSVPLSISAELPATLQRGETVAAVIILKTTLAVDTSVEDGYEEDLFSWSLLDARRGVARANVTLEVPPGIKAGPTSLQATGDLLSGALQAVREPPAPAADPTYAVRPLALACVLLDYLQASGQEEVASTKEAKELAAIGYQRLMAFRRSDGSFAAELDADAEGDV